MAPAHPAIPGPIPSIDAPTEQDGSALARLRLGVDAGYMKSNWPLCGQLADFCALFVLHGQQSPFVATASTVFNELIENAVKYALSGTGRIDVQVWATSTEIVMQTQHAATEEQAALLTSALRRVEATETAGLIESNATEQSASGVGLASIVREYDGRVHGHIEPGDDHSVVTVRVNLAFPDEG